MSVCERVKKLMCLTFCSPATVSGLLTELPSGGLSPTMLGSWALGGGEYTGGLGPCSLSNFFGTLKRKRGGAKVGEFGDEGIKERYIEDY